MADYRSRVRGCLLGGAVGDALGAPIEFMSMESIRSAYGPQGLSEPVPAYGRVGAITDDTQMTLFTAEGVLRAWVRWSLRGIGTVRPVLAGAYLRWLKTQGYSNERSPPHEAWLSGHRELFAQRAPGRTCLRALIDFDPSRPSASNDSKGCGGVMRVAPIGLMWSGKLQAKRAFDVGCQAAALTHGHPDGQLAAGVLATIIALLLDGQRLDASVLEALSILREQDASACVHEAVERALAAAARKQCDVGIPVTLGAGWVAEEALAIGIYCALVSDEFASGVLRAVNHGGDSDSTGSIAGQLLGTIHGEASIPARWLADLELSSVIAQVSDDLCEAATRDLEDGSAESEALIERYPGC